MGSYLFSALRREKRGCLAAQLRLYQARQSQSCGETINIRYLKCMLCGVRCQPEVMQLHEIIARGLIGNKEALEQLPAELHALLCPSCNMERADHQVSRHKLLQYSVEMWGRECVREAIGEFNECLKAAGGMPLSPTMIDYKLLEGNE